MITLSLEDIKDTNKQNEMSMLAMVAFGFGEIFGGLVIGQVVDRMNSRIASLVNSAFVAVTTIFTIIYLVYL